MNMKMKLFSSNTRRCPAAGKDFPRRESGISSSPFSRRWRESPCSTWGWHCKFAVELGARWVLGIDLSQKMIEEARRRNSGAGILYRVCGIDEYKYPEAAWDCVISNLALHYIENLDSIFEKVH